MPTILIQAPDITPPPRLYEDYQLPATCNQDESEQPPPSLSIEGPLASVLLAPVCAISPILRPEHAHRIPFLTRVIDRHTPCYYFMADDPKEGSDGVWTIEASCICCYSTDSTCKTSIGGAKATIVRIVIDPTRGSPAFIEAVDFDAGHRAGGEKDEDSADTESLVAAEAVVARRSKRRRVMSTEGGDGERVVVPRITRARGAQSTAPSNAMSENETLTRLQSFAWDTLSPTDLGAISTLLDHAEESNQLVISRNEVQDLTARCAQASKTIQRLERRLGEATKAAEDRDHRFEDLEGQVEELRAQAEQYKKEIDVMRARTDGEVVVKRRESEDASLGLVDYREASMSAGPTRTDKRHQMWVDSDITVPVRKGQAALGQNCGIFLDRWDGSLKLVGQFEMNHWEEVEGDPEHRDFMWPKMKKGAALQ